MATVSQHEEQQLGESAIQEQPLTRRVTVHLTDEASRRLRVRAALRDIPMGRIVSELVMENLPPAQAGEERAA